MYRGQNYNIKGQGKTKDTAEKELGYYSEDLKAFFAFIKYSKDKVGLRKFIKEHKSVFESMNRDTYFAITAVTHSQELQNIHIKEIDNKNGGINVCQAITEIRMEGVEEGRVVTLIRQICKKLKKNKGIYEIAEELELDVEDIKDMVECAKKYAPDYDVEKIYESFCLVE